MRTDAEKIRKVLYGITAGMTNKELVEHTGCRIETIGAIRKDPEKYLEAAKEQKGGRKAVKKKQREYSPEFKEEFALEWEWITSQIKKYAGWEGEEKNG